MKKILSLFLVLTCFFALMLELTNSDEWSWREYITYVTENIEDLPQADLTFTKPSEEGLKLADIGEFLLWLGELLFYPIRFVAVLLKNAGVILSGFLPFSLDYIPDASPGGGFGGGGGGAR